MSKYIGLFRIGNDPELKVSQSGTSYIQLSLASNWGQKRENTQWVGATLFGKRAEASAPYLVKGGQILGEIRDLHIETYEKDGRTQASLKGVLEDFEYASSRKDSEGQAAAPARAAPAKKAAPAEPPMDDDIPF
ncbi:single-stranded DNA-binding protein [Sinimarinibacterium sp. NLF-5-8]|uniref:single-stranded DNA-binding protein n=1 Tax=Sinimarinibacterium sp. NLF-5-8 TaxID=2698684 RepID=UPI00137BBD4F|nr:single-stranded DNA-binding protein [Sinimarinibacterium sp. NLF-5-8]QHS09051.1 single-stranded DNA-binding protein [Sinimarinibacterium sp. NLF-5-8]